MPIAEAHALQMHACRNYHAWILQILGDMPYYTPRNEVEGGYTGFTLFVCPSVCLSVCPSVRPSVGRCPDDNSHSFQWI